ncbi:hypothetical protein [Photobacterium rosenbergii]|uniref:hypothetical protein n=1 Tax=Photobacterium rosenbergii TaxID=294936 RepID=UPI001C99BA68|nr:hypothetical protein [Photobacterium rosenbergii]MBY5947696.1 hypothetical protein [Photobacterium rosenbergii]
MIRLVTVIVLVGLLAVTAAFSMLGIQSDARRSTLKSIASTMQTTSEIVHTKAIVSGVTDACYRYSSPQNQDPDAEDTQMKEIEGITLCFGYPTGHQENVSNAFNIDRSKLKLTNTDRLAGHQYGLTAYVSFQKLNHINTQDNVTPRCYVRYKDAKTPSGPTIYDVKVVVDEC